jgi:nucleoside-diphosphate kinase
MTGAILSQQLGPPPYFAPLPPPPGCNRHHPPPEACSPDCLWNVGRALVPGRQRTLALLKPDAVRKGVVQVIAPRIIMQFRVLRSGRMTLTRGAAADFYGEHAGKPFFDGLVSFMASGEMVILLLEGIAAIDRWRAMLGATDPRRAESWTVRGQFGNKDGLVWENIGHGSSSPEDAKREIAFVGGDEWIAQRGERWSPREGVWIFNDHPLPADTPARDPGAGIKFDVDGAVSRLKRIFDDRTRLADMGRMEAAAARGIRNRHELELVLDALGITEGGDAWVTVLGKWT